MSVHVAHHVPLTAVSSRRWATFVMFISLSLRQRGLSVLRSIVASQNKRGTADLILQPQAGMELIHHRLLLQQPASSSAARGDAPAFLRGRSPNTATQVPRRIANAILASWLDGGCFGGATAPCAPYSAQRDQSIDIYVLWLPPARRDTQTCSSPLVPL